MSDRLATLSARIKKYKSLAIAFSGGVDSTFLAAAASRVLGPEVTLITVSSQFQPERETRRAAKIAKKMELPFFCLEIDMMASDTIRKNDEQRCYFCKKLIFSEIKQRSEQLGIRHIAHGVNLDDLGQYRPGLKAARELGYVSPLADSGFTKAEIRQYSKEMGLETWHMASHSCLATRIPYGRKIFPEALEMVEKAENFLFDMGFKKFRIRLHGKDARIEMDETAMESIVKEKVRGKIVKKLRALGFQYIALDLEGYIQGSMDRFYRGNSGTAPL